MLKRKFPGRIGMAIVIVKLQNNLCKNAVVELVLKRHEDMLSNDILELVVWVYEKS